MRNVIIGILFLILTGTVSAQQEKVIPLLQYDADEAKDKYETLKNAEKSWDDFQAKIRKEYHLTSITNNYFIYWEHPGFENGFQFSDDFKFIVPKPPVTFYRDGCNYFVPMINPNNIILTDTPINGRGIYYNIGIDSGEINPLTKDSTTSENPMAKEGIKTTKPKTSPQK